MSDETTETTEATEVKTRNKSPFSAADKTYYKKKMADAILAKHHLNGDNRALSFSGIATEVDDYWPQFEKLYVLISPVVEPANAKIVTDIFIKAIDELRSAILASAPTPVEATA